jgi:membrane protease subunit HflK
MKVRPRARAAANRIVNEAAVYRAGALNEAKGAAAAFLRLADEAERSPEAVKRRLWLDAVGRIMARGKKLVVQPAEAGRPVRVIVDVPPAGG